MESLKVSIVMSVYNEEALLERCLASIFSQTFADFECVVVNDGSTDGTGQILGCVKDARLRVISKLNTGLADSLNDGLEQARGEYIARMDGDDVMVPERLERQVAFLDAHPNVVLVGSFVRQANGTGHLEERRFPTEDGPIRDCLLNQNPFMHSSVMFRRSVVTQVGAYDPRYLHAEDCELWIRMARVGRVAIVPEFLVTRREVRNLVTRPAWKGVRRSDVYRLRLQCQVKAMCLAPWNLRRALLAGIFLAKTTVAWATCALSDRLEKLFAGRRRP